MSGPLQFGWCRQLRCHSHGLVVSVTVPNLVLEQGPAVARHASVGWWVGSFSSPSRGESPSGVADRAQGALGEYRVSAGIVERFIHGSRCSYGEHGVLVQLAGGSVCGHDVNLNREVDDVASGNRGFLYPRRARCGLGVAG